MRTFQRRTLNTIRWWRRWWPSRYRSSEAVQYGQWRAAAERPEDYQPGKRRDNRLTSSTNCVNRTRAQLPWESSGAQKDWLRFGGSPTRPSASQSLEGKLTWQEVEMLAGQRTNLATLSRESSSRMSLKTVRLAGLVSSPRVTGLSRWGAHLVNCNFI